MLTLFTCPKAFTNPHTAVIQRNAITSWTRLRPRPEIIVFGDEEGIAAICRELGLRHVPELQRNGHGTPLLDDLLAQARRLACYPLLCYVNADIVFLSDFADAVRRVSAYAAPLLMIGQRWGMEVSEVLPFHTPDWEATLRDRVLRRKEPHGFHAIDYFVFSRSLYAHIPPFALGRFTWDHWLVWHALRVGATVFDATQVVLAVHQNHDYSHHPGGLERMVVGQEVARNTELAGYGQQQATIRHATKVLTARGVRSAWPRKLRLAVHDFLYDWLVYRTARPRRFLGLRRTTLSRLQRLAKEV